MGSVKSNLGHADAVAGLMGVVNAIVAIENGVVPATINHVQDNQLATGLQQGRLKASIPLTLTVTSYG